MKHKASPARRFMRPTDWIWILLLIGVAMLLCFWLRPASTGAYACIYHEEELLATVPLTEDRTFSLSGYPNLSFEVKNGAIRFASSDCPDQICVRTGFLSHGSQYAVCLPNRISVRVYEEAAPDAVTLNFLNGDPS